jgi:hypothetical protein
MDQKKSPNSSDKYRYPFINFDGPFISGFRIPFFWNSFQHRFLKFWRLIFKRAYKKEKRHNFERIVVGKQSRFFTYLPSSTQLLNILFQYTHLQKMTIFKVKIDCNWLIYLFRQNGGETLFLFLRLWQHRVARFFENRSRLWQHRVTSLFENRSDLGTVFRFNQDRLRLLLLNIGLILKKGKIYSFKFVLVMKNTQFKVLIKQKNYTCLMF